MEGGFDSSFSYFPPAHLGKEHEGKPLLIYFTAIIIYILLVLPSQSKRRKLIS
jgi:hypothetical protein